MFTQNLLDKKLNIKAITKIAGKKADFVTLTIEQSYAEHHYFQIQLDFNTLQKSFMDNPLEQMDLISQLVVIEIQHGDDNGNAYVFKGLITDIELTGKDGKHGYIILKGFSPTIMLERGKRMDIYSDMSLKKVFDEASNGVYDHYLEIVNNPEFKGKVDFLMQYNESDWDFIRRIAYLYGINIFFSGSQLLIGNYEEWKPVSLNFLEKERIFTGHIAIQIPQPLQATSLINTIPNSSSVCKIYIVYKTKCLFRQFISIVHKTRTKG